MERSLNLLIHKKVRMSKEGFERLGQSAKHYYQPFVYKFVFSCKVDSSSINCEENLAKFIFDRLGGGTFIVFKNRDEESKGRKGFKYLAQVKISPITEFRFTYEFVTTKGIARYEFWQKDY